HGLIFSWQGPNTPKATVPSSALYVTSDLVPQAGHLIHHWAFEDGVGATAVDNGSGADNLTLSGMDNTNWRSCPDGSCLWFDGNNDVAEVEVDAYDGNLTVSQWVWANTTAQSNYASTFAISDQAGSNASFQHMVSSNQWRLHNNQTKTFGDVVAQRWTHLVTVFDDGDIRQYMDGVLVNEDVYPSGSFTNIDLYKLGVNRAGSAYFEGMVDEVMVWDIALEDQDITRLRRTIIDNCTSYSGAGTEVASLETTFTVPIDLMDHAWNIYVYGKREGEVNGAFSLNVDALDGTGTVLSNNVSERKTFTTSWTSQAMRMRPAAGANQFTIQVALDIDSTSTVGSLFIDSVVLRAIRPHMDWVNGSIADTAVSTGGRSFEWGTTYGQSLVADLLEDGVSGVKGYVYEPYLTAVGLPSTFLPTYASGYNLAESHAAANLYTSWMGVVVGDPKMAPYVNTLHDVNLMAVRPVGDINFNESTTLEVLVENLGMAPANGTLEVRAVLGNTLLHQSPLTLPAGDAFGSRTTVNLTITPMTTGYLDLKVRYVNNTSERNFGNNLQSLSLVVNAPPVIEDVYCSASSLSRGGYTICSVEATDDNGLTNATLQWQILGVNESLNGTSWLTLPMGPVSPTLWQTSLVVPADASLGAIALRALVQDGNNMTAIATVENVTQVVDAPPTWYGPHASGVDPPNWNNASFLPNKPSIGLLRHVSSTLTACVMDADYQLSTPPPVFMASRGEVGNATYVPQSAANLYCYSAVLSLEQGSDLEDVNVEVRSSSGSLLLQRTFSVDDRPPVLSISVESEDGAQLDRVVGNGNERVRIEVSDIDDPGTSFIGDITLQWPGGEPIQVPLDISEGETTALVHLQQLMIPLEGGDLQLTASGSGQHGATSTASITIPFLLTPPTVVLFEACDANGAVENMTFGQVATLVVGLVSDRPLQSSSAQLTQSGWAINAPAVEQAVWEPEQPPAACNPNGTNNGEVEWLYFRLKLDNSLVDGPGRVVFSASDIDGLTKSESLDLMFQHAPTTFDLVEFSPPTPGQDLYSNVSVGDLDGLEQVVCAYSLYDADGGLLTQSVLPAGPEGSFTNQLVYQYPIPVSLANTTLEVNFTCMDNLQQSFFYNTTLVVDSAQSCGDCQQTTGEDQNPANEDDTNLFPWAIVLIMLVAGSIFLLTVLRRKPNGDMGLEWGDEALAPLENTESLFEQDIDGDLFSEDGAEEKVPSIVPEGWTLDAYTSWLDGPVPEEWSEEQWAAYVVSSKATLAEHAETSEG
ncbi:MAG: hypothetical protein DWC05_03405, partial [Candidatus Poseidoniales archaeon]